MKLIYKNQKIKIFSLLLMLVGIVSLGFFMQSCSNEMDDYLEYNGQYKEHLSINNFEAKTVFSESEKTILKEAMNRVIWSTIYGEKGFVVTQTASELNMDEGIYNVMKDFVSLANNPNNPIKPRLKSDNEFANGVADLCVIAQIAVNVYFNTQPGGSFSNDCFNHYWSGNTSTMVLTSDRFTDIGTYASKSSTAGMTPVNIGGQTYYQAQVNFTGTPYQNSLGTATITYNSNCQPVGIHDTYDFDSKSIGERTPQAEAATRAINVAGNACGATSYDISYGIHK